MYVSFYWLSEGLQVFLKGYLLSHTLYSVSNSFQPLATGSGSVLGAGASRASPGISIEQTATVVARTPYIWGYVSVLLYLWDFSPDGNRTRDMLLVFWSPH